jgi:hypothetical protein
MPPDQSDDFTPEETARRRDAVLKIMVNTPPQPRANHRPDQGKRKSTGVDRASTASARQQKP